MITFTTATVLVTLARAQSTGGEFEVAAHSTDGGGGRSTDGLWELHGTMGQAALGALATGGAFELSGGFRRSRASGAALDAIFSDGFENP